MRTNQLHCVGLALLFSCIRCSAADLDFYHRFLSLVDTNDLRAQGVTNALLVDVNNTAPKLTNSAISLQKLRTEGEVGNIRLGMTMEDVVVRWGKPIWLHPRCDGGHKFNFTDCSLVFVGNSLSKVRFRETAVFDQGLSAQSNLKRWEQILGEPTLQSKDSYGSSMVYEKYGSVRTVMMLTFEPDGEVKFPPALYLDPPLTNWSKMSQP
jgi:hypothetical protein